MTSPDLIYHRHLLTLSSAESALTLEESKPGFSIQLLHIVASDALPLNTRLAGALFFKNFIKFNYVVCGPPTRRPPNDF